MKKGISLVAAIVFVSLCVRAAEAPSDFLGRWLLREGAGQSVREATDKTPSFLGARAEEDDQDPAWADGFLVFNGVNDCVTLGNEDSYALSDTGTLCAWVKPAEGDSAHDGSVVIKRSNYYLWRRKDGKLAFGYYYVDGASEKGYEYETVICASAAPAGKWSHAAVSWDGKAVRFFVDGKPSGESPQKGPVKFYRAPTRLGCEQADVRAYAGSIASVSIYARALSAEEVKAEMEAFRP
ncbi:MAG: LamG domain-containing protein [Planctomycetota bacterium]